MCGRLHRQFIRMTQNQLNEKQAGSPTAVGGFVRSVHTVVVTVAHPDARYAAFGDGTLELSGGTRDLGYDKEEKIHGY